MTDEAGTELVDAVRLGRDVDAERTVDLEIDEAGAQPRRRGRGPRSPRPHPGDEPGSTATIRSPSTTTCPSITPRGVITLARIDHQHVNHPARGQARRRAPQWSRIRRQPNPVTQRGRSEERRRRFDRVRALVQRAQEEPAGFREPTPDRHLVDVEGEGAELDGPGHGGDDITQSCRVGADGAARPDRLGAADLAARARRRRRPASGCARSRPLRRTHPARAGRRARSRRRSRCRRSRTPATTTPGSEVVERPQRGGVDVVLQVRRGGERARRAMRPCRTRCIDAEVAPHRPTVLSPRRPGPGMQTAIVAAPRRCVRQVERGHQLGNSPGDRRSTVRGRRRFERQRDHGRVERHGPRRGAAHIDADVGEVPSIIP